MNSHLFTKDYHGAPENVFVFVSLLDSYSPSLGTFSVTPGNICDTKLQKQKQDCYQINKTPVSTLLLLHVKIARKRDFFWVP